MGSQRGYGGGSGNFLGHRGNFGSAADNLVVVETLLEEEAMVVEAVAAEVVIEVVMVDIVDLEVMVAAMLVVMVTACFCCHGFESLIV